MKIKKGDQVKIINGKDRGKAGSVLKVLPETNKLIVDGLNLYKKRSRPKRQGQKGETVLVPRPLDASNVMLVCKNCKNPTRIAIVSEGSTKIRRCKKCQANV